MSQIACVKLHDKQWSLFTYVTSDPLARASSSPVADLKILHRFDNQSVINISLFRKDS